MCKFRPQFLFILILCGFLTHFGATLAVAQGCVVQLLIQKLDNPALSSFDLFGSAVAVDGDLSVIGAKGDSPGGLSGAGSAYVLNVSSGVVQSILVNPDSASGDSFGFSVDISNGTAVVGAPFDNPGGVNDVGTAYVFNATSGALLATLNNPFPAALDGFGYAVAIDGPLVVIGSIGDDPGGAINSGSAFVFDWTTGAIPPVLVELVNPSSSNYDNFGNSVDICGNRVIVGAPVDNFSGAAHIFNATTGALVVTLDNPTPESSDNFGCDVGISDSWAAVGAFGDSSDGVDGGGIAYIFGPETGIPVSTLHDPTPTAYEYFGDRIAVSDTFVVVGNQYGDVDGIGDAGSCHVFDPASGDLVVTLDNPTPHDEDWFCRSVAISDTCIVVGAANDNPGNVTDGGCAYAYALEDNAAFVSHTMPAQVPQNYVTPITITFCNNGGTEWSEEGLYDVLEISDDCDLFDDADIEFDPEEVVPPYRGQDFYVNTYYNRPLGPCNVEFRMARNGIPFGESAICTFEIVPALNDADLVNHTFPDELDTEDSLTFTIVVRNTGNTSWFDEIIDQGPVVLPKGSPEPQALGGSNHALGVFGSDDCGLLSQSRFTPAGIIFPNKNFMAFVHLTAPATPGECSFTLRMLEEGVEWFGETFTHTITIGEPLNSARSWAIYQ